MHITCETSLSGNERIVLNALNSLSQSDSPRISTRDVSTQCQLSIYQTRYILMKLEEKGVVAMFGTERKHRKKWQLVYRTNTITATVF
ncbi:TPA: FaeA/PapI family transcriptional regulator [Serratia marcescens]